MALFATHVVTPDSALGGMVIERSLRFNGDNSPKMTRTFGTNTSNTTKTISFWLKRGKLGSSGMQNIFCTALSGYIEGRLRINTDDTLQFEDRDASGGTSDGRRQTSAKLRDASAWYHIMLVLDSTQGTEADRAKIYINGTQATIGADRTISQNYSFSFMRSSAENYIGEGTNEGSQLDGYLAEVHLIDGQALDPSYFGFTSQNGTWLPKKYTGGNYGTNGFYLDFLDNTSATTLGYDKSGNANHFTPNNITVSTTRTNDSFLDTPTNNFPTLNPRSLYHVHSTSSNTAEGNLRYNCTSDNQGQVPATMSMPTSGKWYFEAEVISNANFAMGIVPATWSQNHNSFSNEPGTLGYAAYGSKFENGSEGAGWGAGWDTGNWAGAAVDMDLKQVTFYKNNTSQGTLSFKSGYEDIEYLPIITGGTNSGTVSGYVNFGAQGFKYTPPTGFKALNSRNRAGATGTAAVVNPERFFETLLWSGTGSSPRTVGGLEFEPDFVWLKDRTEQNWNRLQNSVVGANKLLYSNSTNAEATDENNGHVNAFTIDGFIVDDASGNAVNKSGNNYVAWCWKAGGAAVSNTDGDITSQVSVNEEAGFSIATYTGSTASGALTVGHGLGKKPAWVIIKRRDSTGEWIVGHQGLATDAFANNKFLKLDSTSSTFTNSLVWGAEPTTTVTQIVTNGAGGAANLTSSGTYVMYSWAEIPGFSKFGSYVGDGRSDRFSTFVYTGFRPAWVMIKRTSGTQNWRIFDNKRNTFNDVDLNLQANTNGAEFESSAYNALDFLSNGFKLVGTNADEGTNQSGQSYIYMAFAEQPNGTIFGIDSDAR